MAQFSTHNHSHYSNLRLLDSINRPEEMIRYAHKIGLKGICLTDHEVLSGHVKFIQAYKKLKTDKENPLPDDFKIGLGNEIYLVKEDSEEELKENYFNRNPDTKFYHFILLALNPDGHRQLRELSSIAWEGMFKTGPMERVPTYRENLRRIIKQGDVVASSACLGGELPQMILQGMKAKQSGDMELAQHYSDLLQDFVSFCIEVFGKEHFYFEIQPSDNVEQVVVNKKMIELSAIFGVKYIVATDGHYLTKDDRHAHKTYLQSSEGEREVDDFYSATYIMSEEEIRSYMGYLSEEELQTAFDNTMEIHAKMEQYDLFHKTIIPHPEIPDYTFEHMLKPGYEKYEYIKKFAYSEHPIDVRYLHLIQQGIKEKIINKPISKEYFHICLARINTELRELWLISEKLEDRMAAYYALTRDVVDLMWEEGDSIVGVARGSAAGYFTNFLSGITQINPLDYNLPHFRHLTAERPELPDKHLSAMLATA